MGDAKQGMVTVKIYDREYALRTSGDSARLLQICSELDRRMREVAMESGAVDTLKVAILTALSLEEELLRTLEELQEMDETVSRRSQRCVSMLDRFLC